MTVYDSRPDTYEHIRQVQIYINRFIEKMGMRSIDHDRSKLSDPELAGFNKYTPLLKDMTYGSDEYKHCLQKLKTVLDHHYANNSHHPEHYEDGIRDMCLLDLLEMLADWLAATQRTKGGNIYKSIDMNAERFGYSDELKQILKNTIDRLDEDR